MYGRELGHNGLRNVAASHTRPAPESQIFGSAPLPSATIGELQTTLPATKLGWGSYKFRITPRISTFVAGHYASLCREGADNITIRLGNWREALRHDSRIIEGAHNQSSKHAMSTTTNQHIHEDVL
jgi:hypothetical protein